MAEPATNEHTLSIQDWSLLPEELLNIISKNLDDCFDAIHARSVCTSWRSAFPFPSCLLRPSYSIPSFINQEDSCTLEKVPLFLFTVRASASASKYILGGIGRDKSEDHMKLSSPIQCSVKVQIIESDPALMNMLDFHVFPLGNQYRMSGWDDPKERRSTRYRAVAFLPLNKEGGGEFAVLHNFNTVLLALRSSEMRWIQLKRFSGDLCKDLITFRGRFYAIFGTKEVFVIDPYSLEATPMMISSPPLYSTSHLVASGNDELFLVERTIPPTNELYFRRFDCIVSRLDEEGGKWVEVTELGDRVLFIGEMGNVSCSAKELPDGCGVSGNSILFTNGPGSVTSSYKYGVHTGGEGDHLNCWGYSEENRVVILRKSPVVALLVNKP